MSISENRVGGHRVEQVSLAPFWVRVAFGPLIQNSTSLD